MSRTENVSAHTIVVFLAWAVSSAALLTFASSAWPIPTGDAGTFVPPMLSWARGDGLLNCVWSAAQMHDPTGQTRMVSHGFLFPMVIGSLARTPTFESVAFVIGLMQVVTLGLWAMIFWRIRKRVEPGSYSWPATVVCILGLTGLATFLVGFEGRPEPFVCFLLATGILALLIVPARYDWIVVGSTLGLIAGTSPIAGLIAAFAATAYGAWHLPAVLWIRWTMKVAAASIVILLCLFLWYPYSLREWISGCLHHSAQVRGRASSGLAFYYWITAPQATGYGFVFLLGLCIGAVCLWRARQSLRCPNAFIASLLGFLAAGYYFGGQSPARNYNILIAAPLFYALILIGVSRFVRSSRGYWLLILGAFVVVGFSGAGFYRALAIFPFYVKYGVSLSDARQRVMQLHEKTREYAFLDTGLFPLTGDCRGVTFSENRMLESATIVLQQADHALLQAPVIPGYDLVEDRFCGHVPQIFGVKLANSVRGYDYAIYSRRPQP